tara:strand:- start:396 stop:1871 length:1476 start_codon:yes stop_codon:yes gene_type:complete
MTDTAQDLSKLSLAFDRANTSITRTGEAFGELARSSQEWNIISRILSGTGMWRVQNQIRAVGNIINVMHKRQEEATKSTIESIEANLKLADSLKDIQKARKLLIDGGKALENDPLYNMFSGIKGVDPAEQYSKYWDMADERIKKAQKSVKKAILKSLIPNATRDFLKGGFTADSEGKGGIMNYFKDSAKQFKTTGFGRHLVKGGGGLMDIGMSGTFGKMSFLRNESQRGDIKGRAKTAFANLGKKLGPIAGKIGQFFVVGLAFLGKAMIGLVLIVTGIALLIFIIKKMKLGTRFKKFEEQFGLFGKILANIKEALTGVFMMFQGAFGGDGKKLQDGFIKMMNGLIGILLRTLQTMLSLLLKGIFTVIGGIVKFIGGKIPSSLGGRAIKGFGNDIQGAGASLGGGLASFANGGVSSGGMALVGERGPELVRLPSGARVHSNAESRRMAGSNIHVHVNGRVGASDAEIRDIANKVAREINLKMNRTAHTTGRL